MLIAFRHSLPVDWLPAVICRSGGISVITLLDTISAEYRLHDPFWKQNQRGRAFVIELASLVAGEYLLKEGGRMTRDER